MNSRTIPRLSVTQLHSTVANWNGMHPVGTAVEVTMDDGSVKATTTSSQAWIMGGHSAVIQLVGISGGYSLSRVRALPGKGGGK